MERKLSEEGGKSFFNLKEKLLLACAFGLTIVVLASSVQVHAYTASNWVWASGSPYRNPHKYYRTTTIWSEFSTSVSDWAGTDFGTLQISSSPDDAVTTVRAVNDGNNNVPGYWQQINYSGWTLYSARVTFNSYYDTMTTNEKRECCGHELGHDLGLDETGYTPAQIMYPSVSANVARGVWTPQTGQNADIWGVNSIY